MTLCQCQCPSEAGTWGGGKGAGQDVITFMRVDVYCTLVKFILFNYISQPFTKMEEQTRHVLQSLHFSLSPKISEFSSMNPEKRTAGQNSYEGKPPSLA
jgi:hypothetical protein